MNSSGSMVAMMQGQGGAGGPVPGLLVGFDFRGHPDAVKYGAGALDPPIPGDPLEDSAPEPREVDDVDSLVDQRLSDTYRQRAPRGTGPTPIPS